ncbi:beta-lactamase superfamily domain-domain-containing protein [Kockovaella imperatae]|uniref:Beta-lactamase superfamily domain-domain-containing protein n=1 Tax=Kockovaella imperatae TaxID=4999 RepID=A0A1Y1UMH2_9TREE|nr:beta-lactamase superfamily domain-domain-containing protein [Kockovaella imperatae]ORX39258.1 beta-lactamase superfamily domain-domain-containing protein [Kockovaella imperatae]
MPVGLRRIAIVLPLAYTGAWLGYYAYTDTLRRAHIRRRQREFNETIAGLPNGEIDYTKPATDIEKDALRKRFASLKFAGRYWNPYVEWREQGAWEWAFWKVILSTVTLKLFYNGGVPDERPIPDLPIERPDFAHLFGVSSGRSTPLSREEKGLGMTKSKVDLTDDLTITWLGQSTSYVTMDNLGILTDPALSDQPLNSMLAPHRLRPSPCTLDELQKVDVVLVSHNHFDHLDPEAIKTLGDSCEWIVPVGVGPFIRKHGVTRVKELDWWEETSHVLETKDKDICSFTITCVPLMHWSARSPLDTNATMWSGFHIRSHPPDNRPSRSFIHLGDTGHSPTLFSAIGRVLGPIDLAAIPIGAYEPRWHLHLQHTDPEGAVRMAMQLGVKKSIGVHWGTWLMSDEAYNQPPKDLEIAKRKLMFPVDRFIVTPAGRTVTIED